MQIVQQQLSDRRALSFFMLTPAFSGSIIIPVLTHLSATNHVCSESISAKGRVNLVLSVVSCFVGRLLNLLSCFVKCCVYVYRRQLCEKMLFTNFVEVTVIGSSFFRFSVQTYVFF